MAGVLEPTKGNVLFKGERVSSMRDKLGVVPESTGLYSRLTAWENIRYHSRIYGVEDDVAWNRVSHFAKQLDLSDSYLGTLKDSAADATKDRIIESISAWT